ncbi:MAG: hypothetical protein HUK08_04915, partial [Bacteroidaceae bacterium]|nr:hypothetical protein [Bacteroidaceae bacterium]
KLWNDASNENAKIIENTEAKIKQLNSALKDMQDQLERTYSSERYDLQRQIISNLQQQIEEEKTKLEAMRKDLSGKSSEYTQDDIDAQTDNIKELERNLADAYDSLAEDLTQETIPGVGDKISSAVIDALAGGGTNRDVQKAVGDMVKSLMKTAAINLAKTELIMPWIEEWYKKFEDIMSDSSKMSDDAIQQMQDEAIAASEAFADRIRMINQMFGGDDADTSTLSGAIKGASQESIDLLAGYTNATRIIQSQQLGILERQLSSIASIDANVGRAVEMLDHIQRRMGATIINNNNVAQAGMNANRAYGILQA